jgi:hypothetical protein
MSFGQILDETDKGGFLSVSDVHFNPFYDHSLVAKLSAANVDLWEAILKTSKDDQISGDRQDANFILFDMALAQMKEVDPNPEIMLVTGDFLSHNFTDSLARNFSDNGTQTEFANKTIQFAALMFQKYFPNTEVLPVLGNNDSYCGDYLLQPKGAFLKMFARAWVPLQHNMDAKKDSAFVNQFGMGGYYTYSPASCPDLQIVLMNTVYFSTKYYDGCGLGNSLTPGTVEMAWLNTLLKKNATKKAKAQKIWMAYHVPPGMDVYSSIRKGDEVTMWNDSFSKSFIALTEKYQDVIKANFAGHTHMDEFRVLYGAMAKPISFVHITPSISRSNGNYPGFQTVEFKKARYTISNFQTYCLNAQYIASPKWSLEYDFATTYHVNSQTPISLDAIRQKMKGNGSKAMMKYCTYYDVSNPKHVNSIKNNWIEYWCGTGSFGTATFKNCCQTN